MSSGSVKDPVLKARDGAKETASKVKVPAAKAGRLSSILGIHTKGEDSLQQAVLSPLCLHVGLRGAHARTHTYKYIKVKLLKII